MTQARCAPTHPPHPPVVPQPFPILPCPSFAPAELHPRIAAPVADALGVASRRRLLLAASADALPLGLARGGGGVEAFGQSEALTTRLRHIIGDYPEGPSICLELVQVRAIVTAQGLPAFLRLPVARG